MTGTCPDYPGVFMTGYAKKWIHKKNRKERKKEKIKCHIWYYMGYVPL